MVLGPPLALLLGVLSLLHPLEVLLLVRGCTRVLGRVMAAVLWPEQEQEMAKVVVVLLQPVMGWGLGTVSCLKAVQQGHRGQEH